VLPIRLVYLLYLENMTPFVFCITPRKLGSYLTITGNDSNKLKNTLKVMMAHAKSQKSLRIQIQLFLYFLCELISFISAAINHTHYAVGQLEVIAS